MFSELACILERAGPGLIDECDTVGQITGIFTVLVEGDDLNEPITDAVRGLLDGHIVLDRKIGEAGRYPAVDIAKSVSRTSSQCLDQNQREIVKQARSIIANQSEVADLVRLGIYKFGLDSEIDKSLVAAPKIEHALNQNKEFGRTSSESFILLSSVMEF